MSSNKKRAASSLSEDTEENARDAIEQILLTTNAQGSFWSQGGTKGTAAPVLTLKGEPESQPITFPLSDESIQRIKAHAERAPVGTQTSEVVQLNARTTWQLLPEAMNVNGLEACLQQILPQVASDFGIHGKIEPNLYKFLLYEKGCFFRRHRDNERLPRMFGTLVLEMPSTGYEGAELKVWSPTCLHDVKTFNMCDESKAHFAAFYADCFHEVTELTAGHRAAFIFSLQKKKGMIPPQPADHTVAQAMANQMERFIQEKDEDYDPVKLGKPKKLAIVLSHSYTKSGLEEQGIHALKGKDRAVAELIAAAMKTPPSTNNTASDDEVEAVSAGPFFDAVLSLTELWDRGECTPYGESFDDRHGFQTIGRFVPLVEGATLPSVMMDVPTVDGQGRSSNDVPILRHELLIPMYGGNDKKKKEKFRTNKTFYGSGEDTGNCVVDDGPEEIEFLGNGMPYPGRIYNPAVILMWPKANRQAVALQSKGGQEVYNAKK